MSSNDEIRNAIKAIDAKKKDIKKQPFYSGGATGKDQQKLKNYPKRKPKDDHIYPGIKDSIKKKHQHINIVFIHGLGTRYFVVDEDARYIHKKHKKPYRDDVKSYLLTSISQKMKSRCIEELVAENKGYVFLDMIPNTDPIMRKIIDSSDKSIIGDDEY